MATIEKPGAATPATPAGVAEVSARLRRSPLTDPRALVCSLLIHLAILLAVSVIAYRAVAPQAEAPLGRTLRTELEPTDTRAPDDPGAGGGDGGADLAEVATERAAPAQPTRDPAADALLSEILPTRETSLTAPPTVPGPSTNVLGMLNTTSQGEGGGQGGGQGGGLGGGVGPGTEFFGMRDRAGSYAYVIDCSGSMTARGSLDVAKRELLASLGQVPAEARFAVVFYNLDARVFTDPTGREGLMPATPSNKARVRTLLASVQPDGGTDHMKALRAALAFRPEVIFFLTDADLMSRQDVTEILAQVGKTRIQAVEFGLVGGLNGSAPLRSLARSTGGSYRYIDVRTFGR